MEISLVKRYDNSFSLAYDSDFEKVQRWKVGDVLKCNVTKPRNYEFHKKYWALINLVFDNQERYTDIDYLREQITIEAGFYYHETTLKGVREKRAKSIKFTEMDEFEFSDLYEKSKDVICLYFKFIPETIIENINRYF